MRTFIALCALSLFGLSSSPAEEPYAIVVSKPTHDESAWAEVVEALRAKHSKKYSVKVLQFEKSVTETLDELRQLKPRYTCFVSKSADAGREFVKQVHQLTRGFDEDPYTDTHWGILTGFDAANALAIAKHSEALVVRKVASGTEVALEKCAEGIFYDELVKNKAVRKSSEGSIEKLRGPDDTTQVLADTLNDYRADLFVTSGHATERDWMIGFTYKNGFFKSKAGQLYGLDTKGRRIEIESPNPKVYLPIGNCLMGHIDGDDAMALAWMNDVGVKQMVGYTVPTWFGYGGWGLLDYFVEQPGRYTFVEAFLANHHALIHKIETREGNQRGMVFDRDVVALYGDPAWTARMAPASCSFGQTLSEKNGEFSFEIKPNLGEKSFQPVNMNGAQRGWRPFVAFLPRRIGPVEILEGSELKPVVTDDFVLVPNPKVCDPAKRYVVRFRVRKDSAASTTAVKP